MHKVDLPPTLNLCCTRPVRASHLADGPLGEPSPPFDSLPSLMKKPNLTLPATLGRMTAELFIIVAGVLIALGAQSWWDSRGTEDERDRALRALSSDLQLLESTMVGDSLNGAEQMSALRAAIDDPASLAHREDSVLVRTIRTAAWNTVIGNERYAFPAWNDLESSGRLDLLLRPGLRRGCRSSRQRGVEGPSNRSGVHTHVTQTARALSS